MNRLSRFIGFLKQRKAAIFFGAGISKIAGCAGLQDIDRSLLGIKEIQKIITSQNLELDTKEIILYCKNLCEQNEDFRRQFDGIMRKSLTYDLDKYNRDYLPFINNIKEIAPFSSIITTNVDDCLTKTGKFNVDKIYHKVVDMRSNLFRNIGIFHIHGYMEDFSGQVWDALDYCKRYGHKEFQNFIENTFKEYSVLFLGYSFNGDNELKALIAKAKMESLEPQIHFALLPSDEPHPHINDEMYRVNYNIEIVRYGSKTDFIKIFAEWVDSNCNPAKIGKEEDISYPLLINEGVSQ